MEGYRRKDKKHWRGGESCTLVFGLRRCPCICCLTCFDKPSVCQTMDITFIHYKEIKRSILLVSTPIILCSPHITLWAIIPTLMASAFSSRFSLSLTTAGEWWGLLTTQHLTRQVTWTRAWQDRSVANFLVCLLEPSLHLLRIEMCFSHRSSIVTCAQNALIAHDN